MIEVMLLGFAGGILAGLFGIGGGIVFVPALVVFAHTGQVEAQATSLLAILPMSAIGAYRQHRRGNARPVEGLALGLLSVFGAVAGVIAANALPEQALQLGFAGLLLLAAAQLVHRSREAKVRR